MYIWATLGRFSDAGVSSSCTSRPWYTTTKSLRGSVKWRQYALTLSVMRSLLGTVYSLE